MIYNEKEKRWLPCSNSTCVLSIYSQFGKLRLRCTPQATTATAAVNRSHSLTSSQQLSLKRNNERQTSAASVLLDEIIRPNGSLKFHRATLHFFQWRSASGCVYGLHFSDERSCDFVNQLFLELTHQYQTIEHNQQHFGSNSDDETDNLYSYEGGNTNRKMDTSDISGTNSYARIDVGHQVTNGLKQATNNTSLVDDTKKTNQHFLSPAVVEMNECLDHPETTSRRIPLSESPCVTLREKYTEDGANAPPAPPLPQFSSKQTLKPLRQQNAIHSNSGTFGKPPLPSLMPVAATSPDQTAKGYVPPPVKAATHNSATCPNGTNNFILEIQQRIRNLKARAEENSTVSVGMHALNGSDGAAQMVPSQISVSNDAMKATHQEADQPIDTKQCPSNSSGTNVVPIDNIQLRNALERMKMEIVDSVVSQLRSDIAKMRKDIVQAVLAAVDKSSSLANGGHFDKF